VQSEGLPGLFAAAYYSTCRSTKEIFWKTSKSVPSFDHSEIEQPTQKKTLIPDILSGIIQVGCHTSNLNLRINMLNSNLKKIAINLAAKISGRVLNAGNQVDQSINLAYDQNIPRVIYQTYPGKQLPPDILSNVTRLQSINPGWAYKLFDDSEIVDFIKDNYPNEILEAYLRINPEYGAAKADLFRYLLIYKFGGVYLDIKSTVNRPLDEILCDDDRFILSHWENREGDQYAGWGLYPEIEDSAGEYQQWHIIASPMHPFLGAVIQQVIRNINIYNSVLHGTGRYGIFRVTGPIAYTLAIKSILTRFPYRLVNAANDGIEYSCLDKNGTAHHKLFAAHHVSLKSPIIINP
jgi:hypothetical protein